MKYDEILIRIGEFGSYQKRVYFLLCLPAILCGTQLFSAVFIMAIPNYRCQIPGYSNDTYKIQGRNHDFLINLTIPPGGEDSEGPYSECRVYSDVNATSWPHHFSPGIDEDNVTNYTQSDDVREHLNNMTSSEERGTRSCNKWVYDRSEFDTTAITEFNIVCADKILRSHSNMVQFAGALFGSIFMGIIADVLGRKVAIMLSLLIQFASALGVFFSPSYDAMIGIKGFAGIATHSLFAISASTGIELVGPSKRTFTGIFVEFYWTIGVLLVLPLAYFIRNWRYIQLTICLMTVPLFALWWLIPESPRWLLDKKKFGEAEKVLEKICQSNKTKLPIGAVSADTADEGPQAKIWSIFTHKVLIIRTFIIFFNWLAVNLLYYGLSLNVDNLAGSTYLNYFIGTVVEILGYAMCLFLLNRTGRRKLHCVCMFIGGFACLAVMLPVTLGNKDHQWIATALAMVGKLCASGCYAILYIMSSELFPTVLRNSAIGCCSIFENVGGMISPYVADLGIIIGGRFAKGLPMLVFGVFSLLAGSLSLALPETQGMSMPETIQDAIDFGKPEKVTSLNSNLLSKVDQELQIPLKNSKD